MNNVTFCSLELTNPSLDEWFGTLSKRVTFIDRFFLG
jgi:hypothetical protein